MTERGPEAEENGALDWVLDRAIDYGLGGLWARVAPLTVGAVLGGVALAGGARLVRGLAGRRGSRGLKWLGVAALVPLSIALLAGDLYAVGDQEEAAGAGDRREPEMAGR